MTYRDPDDPRLRSADPTMNYGNPNDPTGSPYAGPARRGGWSAGSWVAAVVVLAIIIAAIAYATNRNTMTASGPGTTHSAPATTGQATPGAPAGSVR